MNLLEFIHFIYNDFDNISIKMANGSIIYDGKIKNIHLDHLIFLFYHEVYAHNFNFESSLVTVRIR